MHGRSQAALGAGWRRWTAGTRRCWQWRPGRARRLRRDSSGGAGAQALDGGYLALLAVEAARGRKLPQALEQTIMASGLLLLSGLGFFLILRDVGNLTGLTRGGLM